MPALLQSRKRTADMFFNTAPTTPTKRIRVSLDTCPPAPARPLFAPHYKAQQQSMPLMPMPDFLSLQDLAMPFSMDTSPCRDPPPLVRLKPRLCTMAADDWGDSTGYVERPASPSSNDDPVPIQLPFIHNNAISSNSNSLLSFDKLTTDDVLNLKPRLTKKLLRVLSSSALAA